MKLEPFVLEELQRKIEELDENEITVYAIINRLKDLYIDLIKNGYVTEETYLSLASYILYIGFMKEE